MSRSSIIIGDEAVLLPKTVYDRIIAPTAEPYRYKGLQMESKEILLTSASTRDNWIWQRLVKNVNKHFKSKKPTTSFFSFDIFGSIITGIHTPSKYENARSNSDDFSFRTEYLNEFLGDSGEGIFKYSDFHEAQTLREAFVPPYLDYDFCSKQIQKDENDIWVRIQAVDIAVVGGKENDRTVIKLGKVNLETGERIVEYIYSMSGTNSNQQVEIIKRLYYQYQCDYCILDTKGVGNVIYDMITVETFETQFDLDTKLFKDNKYPAWSANNDKLLQVSSDAVLKDKLERVNDTNAHSILIPFAGNVELNSMAHYSVWNALRNKLLTLPMTKSIKEQYKNEEDETFFTRSSEEKAEYYRAYAETDTLINETIALDVNRNNQGQLRVSEKRAKDLKDRYMTLAMFNLLADKLYNKHVIQDYETDYEMSDFADAYG